MGFVSGRSPPIPPISMLNNRVLPGFVSGRLAKTATLKRGLQGGLERYNHTEDWRMQVFQKLTDYRFFLPSMVVS